jgi:CheY-like chemotaxis protein
MPAKQPILLLEDDAVDVKTIQRALLNNKIQNPLEVFGNGEEGMAYLDKSENPRPLLVLLDLNMPCMDGIEFLKKVKSESGVRRIPVIVLTNSEDMADINKIFELGAAGFIKKPDDYMEFVRSVKIIYDYWTLCLQPD